MGKALGIDLVKDPSLALQPAIAAKIIYEGMNDGTFTGKSLSTYLDGKIGTDKEQLQKYTNARRIVNGTDKAATIASYALTFQRALLKAEVKTQVAVDAPSSPAVIVPPKAEPVPVPAPAPVPMAPVERPKVTEVAAETRHVPIFGSIVSLITMTVAYLQGLNPIVQVLIVASVAIFVAWVVYVLYKRHRGTLKVTTPTTVTSTTVPSAAPNVTASATSPKANN
jgi:hypothetical protein